MLERIHDPSRGNAFGIDQHRPIREPAGQSFVAALQRYPRQPGDGDRVRRVEFDQLPVCPLRLIELAVRQGLVGLQKKLVHQPASDAQWLGVGFLFFTI